MLHAGSFLSVRHGLAAEPDWQMGERDATFQMMLARMAAAALTRHPHWPLPAQPARLRAYGGDTRPGSRVAPSTPSSAAVPIGRSSPDSRRLRNKSRTSLDGGSAWRSYCQPICDDSDHCGSEFVTMTPQRRAARCLVGASWGAVARACRAVFAQVGCRSTTMMLLACLRCAQRQVQRTAGGERYALHCGQAVQRERHRRAGGAAAGLLGG